MDASSLGNMEMSNVLDLDERLAKQLKDENEARKKALEKSRNTARSRANSMRRFAKRRR